ncbi:acyl-CoA carboxylase subunit epsilon [Streptomyces goshikiensis]|uniref:acyl-CoA carboxylase subunit epsilon n=1 Tax=Streptomyces goshikiensis TaxID=1942 RepID=UPI0037B0F15A
MTGLGAPDAALLRVVRGAPAPEELAALTAVVLALAGSAEAGGQEPPPAPAAPWPRGGAALPEDGSWGARALPGWRS